MSTELFRQAGKELADVVEAFVDPQVDQSKFQEIQEAAIALWNLKDKFGETAVKSLIYHVLLGALEDVGEDYFPV